MPITPDKAGPYPGAPPVMWSPYLAVPYGSWQPGLAVWRRSNQHWVMLRPTSDIIGNVAPDHGTLLTPENPPWGAPNMLTRLEKLEDIVERLSRSL
jgi:hypothetical protein